MVNAAKAAIKEARSAERRSNDVAGALPAIPPSKAVRRMAEQPARLLMAVE